MSLARKINIYDVFDRAKTGQQMEESQWDYEVIPQTASKLKEKYKIKMDKTKMVPEDKTLIDNLYLAGIDMLEECGVYCTDTKRVIKYTREEIMAAIESVPTNVQYGEGKEALFLNPRSYDSKKPPIIQGGPTGAPCSEDLFLAIHQSYAQEGLVDCIVDGVMQTINGKDPTPGSPYEIAAVRAECLQVRDACMRAGRPGMGL
jgi:methylamine--corrinoid protein Co-methyltransferase